MYACSASAIRVILSFQPRAESTAHMRIAFLTMRTKSGSPLTVYQQIRTRVKFFQGKLVYYDCEKQPVSNCYG